MLELYLSMCSLPFFHEDPVISKAFNYCFSLFVPKQGFHSKLLYSIAALHNVQSTDWELFRDLYYSIHYVIHPVYGEVENKIIVSSRQDNVFDGSLFYHSSFPSCSNNIVDNSTQLL